jgi:uncharacterized Zn finger protein (UPF0148 family)
MRTNRANWDHERNDFGLAPFNDKCPVCGNPCFSSPGPDNTTIRTCPTCDKGDALAASFDDLDIAAVMARLEAEAQAAEVLDARFSRECALDRGLQ